MKALDKSEKSDHDVDLFEALCDFNVLYALDGMMKKADMDDICGLVKKWAPEKECLPWERRGGTIPLWLPWVG